MGGGERNCCSTASQPLCRWRPAERGKGFRKHHLVLHTCRTCKHLNRYGEMWRRPTPACRTAAATCHRGLYWRALAYWTAGGTYQRPPHGRASAKYSASGTCEAAKKACRLPTCCHRLTQCDGEYQRNAGSCHLPYRHLRRRTRVAAGYEGRHFYLGDAVASATHLGTGMANL